MVLIKQEQLDNFDVTKCLPFDIMHTVFEGMAVYHLTLKPANYASLFLKRIRRNRISQ